MATVSHLWYSAFHAALSRGAERLEGRECQLTLSLPQNPWSYNPIKCRRLPGTKNGYCFANDVTSNAFNVLCGSIWHLGFHKITCCVSATLQIQYDVISPYQLQNLTSLVNGDLILLERKYRALGSVCMMCALSTATTRWWEIFVESVTKIGSLPTIQTPTSEEISKPSFYHKCDAKSRSHQTLSLKINGREKNTGC